MIRHDPPDAADGNALAPARAHGLARDARRARATPHGGGERVARPRAGASLPPYPCRHLASNSPPPITPFSAIHHRMHHPSYHPRGGGCSSTRCRRSSPQRRAWSPTRRHPAPRPSPLAPRPRPTRPHPTPTLALVIALTFTLPRSALTLPPSSTRPGRRRRLGGQLQHLGRGRGEHAATGRAAGRAAA
jgi:hypothetical protein